MNNKLMITILISSFLIISACTQTALAPEKSTPQVPARVDVVSETKKTNVIEPKEEIEETAEEVNEEEISEVEELLSIADKKVESIRYSYKGPETNDFFYEFFVKGNKIKYILSPTYFIDVEEDDYDAIYVNKESKTALAYCDHRRCYREGKKAVLDYDESYILTPFDWLNKIESAEKVGEELIDRRNTWKISTSNLETVWIDTFFGIPLRVEFADKLYKFQNMGFNGVKDEDVSVKN